MPHHGLGPIRFASYLALAWLGVSLTMAEPPYVSSLRIVLPEGVEATPALEQRIRACEGVSDVLLVRGEKRQEQETKDGGFHRVERSYGSFQRALNLPADANQDTIKAAFKNGVLTITMEKREASAPKQGRSIPING